MRTGKQIIWMALLAAQPVALTADDPGNVTLTVLVYDYTRMPAFELENAIAVAQRIFQNAGVATRWGAWHGDVRIQCGAVVVNIVRSAGQDPGGQPGRLGSALYGDGGDVGIAAYIFQDQVEQTTHTGGCGRFQVLGHVMAHEVGHLLLGAGSHSATGIMQPRWAVQLMAHAPGRVTFTPEQVQRIRDSIRNRTQTRQQSTPR